MQYRKLPKDDAIDTRQLNQEDFTRIFPFKLEPSLFETTENVFVDENISEVRDWQDVFWKAARKPSRCGNDDRCVYLNYDAFLRLPRMPKQRCVADAELLMRRKLLPSKLLRNLVESYMPDGSTPENTLVVHLRYHAGEYGVHPEYCQTGKFVCIGRFQLFRVPIDEFSRRVLAYAHARNCTHVFPIMPHFIEEPTQRAICEGLGFEFDNLISRRKLNPHNTLLIERALAATSKEFLAEIESTSFTLTIEEQRLGLNLSMVFSVDKLMGNSKIPMDQKHR